MTTLHQGIHNFDILSLTGATEPIGAVEKMDAISISHTLYSLTNHSVIQAGTVIDCADTTAANVAVYVATLFELLQTKLGVKVTHNGD